MRGAGAGVSWDGRRNILKVALTRRDSVWIGHGAGGSMCARVFAIRRRGCSAGSSDMRSSRCRRVRGAGGRPGLKERTDAARLGIIYARRRICVAYALPPAWVGGAFDRDGVDELQFVQTSEGRGPAARQDKALKAAPEFDLKDADGKTVRLSDYKGKVVVLDFWATWCEPCKIEIPWFIEFERTDKNKGFAVVGIAMDDEGWTVVKPFVSKLAINYRILKGTDATADLYGGIEVYPTTFLIGRDGKIAATHLGLTGKDEFEDGIKKLMAAPVQERASSGVTARFSSAALFVANHAF